MCPTTRPPRYMKVDTFDEKMFPSSRAVLGNIFSYKCVPFHVYIFSFLFNVVSGSRIPVPAAMTAGAIDVRSIS